MTASARRRLTLSVALAAASVLGLGSAAVAQDPAVAPATSLSGDGRTVSGAGKTLSASQTAGLAPGQAVTVSGGGYDAAKGVYVSLCVIPPTNVAPSPCGGGQDRSGSTGASAWISSNPPSYAEGLTQPYGPGGSFSVTVTLSPAITASLDCYSVRCAIVTRNDHTRGADRSQDLFLPVTFAAPSAPSADTTTTAPPPVETTTTTTTAPDPSTVPPATELSADGSSVTDGPRTLSIDPGPDDLDPAGEDVVVSGAGYDTAAGVYVALCRLPEGDAAPGPCATGQEASAWISSDPPDYGTDLAVPFGAGGTFEVTLSVTPVIDADTDCRKVACALATRRDDTAADDRTHDLLVPVTFGEERATTTTTEPDSGDDVELAASGGDTSGSGSSLLPFLLGGGVALGAGGAILVRRARRARSTTGAAG